MHRKRISLAEHFKVGQMIHAAYECIVGMVTFFSNKLGRYHEVTLTLKKAEKGLSEAKDKADDLMYHEHPDYDGSSPYYAAYNKNEKNEGQ